MARWEDIQDYYFEFHWWKYLVVFILGMIAGHYTTW
jgi:hypothetical protein